MLQLLETLSFHHYLMILSYVLQYLTLLITCIRFVSVVITISMLYLNKLSTMMNRELLLTRMFLDLLLLIPLWWTEKFKNRLPILLPNNPFMGYGNNANLFFYCSFCIYDSFIMIEFCFVLFFTFDPFSSRIGEFKFRYFLPLVTILKNSLYLSHFRLLVSFYAPYFYRLCVITSTPPLLFF